MKITQLTICLIIGVLFYVCKSPQANASKYTEQQETITVQKGESFVIELPSNITTGFSWQIVDTPAVLQLQTHKYIEDTSEKTGRSGVDSFTFLAKEIGVTPLEFVYKRPWENTENKRKAYQITIK